VNEWSFPLATIARMQFKAKGSRAALDIIWYDGGMRPQVPEELRSEGKELTSNGILFVGDKGKILAGFDLESPQIIPESKMEAFRKGKDIPAPQPLVDDRRGFRDPAVMAAPDTPAAPAARRGGASQAKQQARENRLVTAIKTGKPTIGDYALTKASMETFNLVAISLRLQGKRLLWDSAAGRITNLPDANNYMTREYRKGWDPNQVA